jgi:hypothetical protein
MINRASILYSKLLRALKLEYWQLYSVQEWVSVLFVSIRYNPDNLSRRYRFVSYSLVQSLPVESGEYRMFEGDRWLDVEVDLFALDTELGLSTFLVRSLEKSPRTWEFHSFGGRLSRSFDGNGDLVPRCQLRGISFSPVPDSAKEAIDRVLASLAGKAPCARVRSEREAMV